MEVPFERHYPLQDILTGQVRCSSGAFAIGSAIAALLIAAHIIFLLAPVALTPLLLKAQPRLQLGVRSYPQVIVSMFVFVLASAGEIAQHVFDNWLYIDSRVSTYNFVFYLMTTASNAMLAAGLGTSQIEAVLAIVSCLMTPASFMYAILAGKPYLSTKASIPIWIGMFVTTSLFLYRIWHLELPQQSDKYVYSGVILATYAFGVFCAIQILSTGYQAWHLLTASNFCTGFITQGIWLLKVNTHLPNQLTDVHEDCKQLHGKKFS
ncbi:hypothetical protein WJX79_009067 [Trebouxia sp. C0005]|nr:MAG: hypothetical protein FRX49_10922 [Trebouxia sp. A1-2]